MYFFVGENYKIDGYVIILFIMDLLKKYFIEIGGKVRIVLLRLGKGKNRLIEIGGKVKIVLLRLRESLELFFEIGRS